MYGTFTQRPFDTNADLFMEEEIQNYWPFSNVVSHFSWMKYRILPYLRPGETVSLWDLWPKISAQERVLNVVYNHLFTGMFLTARTIEDLPLSVPILVYKPPLCETFRWNSRACAVQDKSNVVQQQWYALVWIYGSNIPFSNRTRFCTI